MLLLLKNLHDTTLEALYKFGLLHKQTTGATKVYTRISFKSIPPRMLYEPGKAPHGHFQVNRTLSPVNNLSVDKRLAAMLVVARARRVLARTYVLFEMKPSGSYSNAGKLIRNGCAPRF